MAKGYTYWKERLWRRAEEMLYTGKARHTGNSIALLKLDKMGDYILFRNFIEEIYSHFNGTRKLVLCGNASVKEFAEKLDKEFINEFIWVDVSKLQDYSYSFSIYKRLRKAGCSTLINCAYSRTQESDRIALHSGAGELIGFYGDEANILAVHKKANDNKYTKLVHSNVECMFEFYRNRELFNSVLEKELRIEAPYIKMAPLAKEERNKHIMVFPGAGEDIRRWSTDNYMQLNKKLYDIYKLPILICGPPNEKDLGEQIATGQGSSVNNTIGKYDLELTIKAIQGAKFVVSGDTGAMHLALALGIPAICISNGNYYQRFCPYPEAMHMPLTVVYPDEFEKQLNESTVVRCKGSTMDVNAICVDKVVSAISDIFNV